MTFWEDVKRVAKVSLGGAFFAGVFAGIIFCDWFLA